MAKKDENPERQQSRFREFTAGPATPIRVDPEKGVLYDVLILGHNSRNRSTYGQQVMQEAVKHYEGATAYVGHTKDGSNPDYDRRMGVHRNVRVAADGIRGDFHFNPKHRMAEQLVWDATNSPNQVGFSHDADCTYSIQNGRKVVTSIDRVYSVDLVTRPATTHGLFEDEEEALADDPKIRSLAETCLAASDNVRSILFARDETAEAKTARITEALVEWQSEIHPKNQDEVTGPPAPAAGTSLKEEDTHMGVEYKEITVESLTKERPDLVAKLQGTDEHTRLTEEVKTLAEASKAKDAELAALKTEKAKRLKEEEITAELKAANFPTADEVAYSPTFKESLSGAADKTARAAIIADRMALTGRLQEHQLFQPSPMAEVRPTDRMAAKADPTYDGVFGKAA